MAKKTLKTLREKVLNLLEKTDFSYLNILVRQGLWHDAEESVITITIYRYEGNFSIEAESEKVILLLLKEKINGVSEGIEL